MWGTRLASVSSSASREIRWEMAGIRGVDGYPAARTSWRRSKASRSGIAGSRPARLVSARAGSWPKSMNSARGRISRRTPPRTASG